VSCWKQTEKGKKNDKDKKEWKGRVKCYERKNG
jgi:hypothetical protein